MNFHDPFGLKIIGVYDAKVQRAIQEQLRASETFRRMWSALHLSRDVVVELRAASTDEILVASGGANGIGWTTCKAERGTRKCVALFNRNDTGLGGMDAVIDRATHELIHAAGASYRDTDPAGAAGVPGGCATHTGSVLNTPYWGNSGCGDILKEISDQLNADRDRRYQEQKQQKEQAKAP